MEERLDTPGEFSLVKRARSFAHAWRGIWVFLKTTPNAWIEIGILVVVIAAGIVVGITYIEWILLAFVAGFVLVSEAFNTAIEIDINLTSPEYHPYAKDTKDVAAGAVLIASITALIIGLAIFGHHLL